MRKFCRIALNTGLIISFGAGIIHFFLPFLLNWWAYMPAAPRSIIVSIEWTNFTLALLLAGFSLMLLIFQQNIQEKAEGIFEFYVFFVMVWLARVAITYLHPWSNNLQSIDIILLGSFSLVFLLLFIPMIYYWVINGG